eukprot:sb/3474364/
MREGPLPRNSHRKRTRAIIYVYYISRPKRGVFTSADPKPDKIWPPACLRASKYIKICLNYHLGSFRPFNYTFFASYPLWDLETFPTSYRKPLCDFRGLQNFHSKNIYGYGLWFMVLWFFNNLVLRACRLGPVVVGGMG